VLEPLAAAVCGWDDEAWSLAPLLIDKVGEYVDCLPRAAQVALSAQLAAIDHGARLYPPARGRRLSDLDRRGAARYLQRVLGSGLPGAEPATRPLRQTIALCWFDLREVRARLGYDPDPHIARVARRRMERHGAEIKAAEKAHAAPGDGVIDGSEATGSTDLSCDVVIVGTGAGGATVAAALAAAGVDVVMVDEGGYHPTESFGTDTVRAMGSLYRAGGAQTILGKPPIAFLEGRCVGGSTVVNGGMCWRTPSPVLERWAREHGVDAIGTAEMERHFRTVEDRLSIQPQDPESIGRDSQLLERGARARGWTLERSRRNQLHCGGCDNCLCGCPTGAKRSMLVTNVPRALQSGARVVAGCRVECITREGKVATGVRGRFRRDGARLTVRARVVVAACGGVQTPALLARSGFRSASGQLGRNLALHPTAALLALFDEEVNGWQGVHQAFQVSEFMREGILITASSLPPALIAASVQQSGAELADLMAGYSRMVVAGCLVEDRTSGRVRTLPGLGPVGFYDLTHKDAQRVVRGISLTTEAMFAAGARRVVLPIVGATAPLDADATRRLLAGPIPRERLHLLTVHAMGTARMSEDRARGVVSSFGEFHGAAGLFVADASILPGPVGVNPMETIVALATRNAERLVDQRRRFGI
jgi:choline dehydrogenase-like flavoprotein